MRRAHLIGGHVTQNAGNAAPPPAAYDLVIRGATTYESGHPAGTNLDVAVLGSIIAAVEPGGVIPPGAGREEVDAAGLLLTPGLIDSHVHIFAGMTPLGLEVDEWCLGRGCTTVADAGSAGATTVEGFIRYIDGQSVTRCLSFLNISLHGLAGSGGAYAHHNQIKVEAAVAAIEKYRENICGVKVLLTASYANGGKNELEALRAALAATEQAGVPLMTHHTFSEVPLTQCPGADASPIKMRGGHLLSYPSVAPAVMQTP